MKAFAVRLAFGAITILCGAYAAALSQKSDSESDASWPSAADMPATAANPIAAFADSAGEAASAEPWSDPASGGVAWASDTVQWASEAAEPRLASAGDAGVALVGHAEDIMESFAAPPSNENDPADAAGPAPAGFAIPNAASDRLVADPAAPSLVDLPPAGFGIPTENAAAASVASEPADASLMIPTLPSLPVATSDETVSSPTTTPQPTTLPENESALDGRLANPNGNQTFANGFADGGSESPSLSTAAPALAGDLAMSTETAAASDSAATLGIAVDHPTPTGMNGLRDSFPTEQPPFAGGQSVPEAAAPPMPTATLRTPAGAQPFAAAPTLSDGYTGAAYPDPAPAAYGNPNAYGNPTATQPAAVAVPDPSPTGLMNVPGDRRFDGVQTPGVVVQRRAPPNVKVGMPAAFALQVQNVGPIEAMNVRVHDRVPAGTRLVDAVPMPTRNGDLLTWDLGNLPVGDERTVTVRLIPETEGELGSVARVTFEAAASVRTVATRPELKLVQRAPETVRIGGQVEIELEVSNPGTGVATAVVLQTDVPPQFEHPQGSQLDNLIGDLQPGEVRRQILRMRAVEPGTVRSLVRLVSEDGLQVDDLTNIEVIAPKLQVQIAGPARRFLERPATYEVEVANLGTADAENVEIAVQLDRGFNFVSTENQGQYDPSRHTVFWELARLPVGANGRIPLTLLPVNQGTLAMQADIKADLQPRLSTKHEVTVDAFAELDFGIRNPGGPIELGSTTKYEITLTNSGSAADSNVAIGLVLPPGLELVDAGPEASRDARGNIQIAGRSQVAPGETMTHTVTVRGVSPGTHIARAIVTSDGQPVAVTKEESTLVYADR